MPPVQCEDYTMSYFFLDHSRYFDFLLNELTTSLWRNFDEYRLGCQHDIMTDRQRLDHNFDQMWARQDTSAIMTFLKEFIQMKMELYLKYSTREAGCPNNSPQNCDPTNYYSEIISNDPVTTCTDDPVTPVFTYLDPVTSTFV